jgi:hypothetical protein
MGQAGAWRRWRVIRRTTGAPNSTLGVWNDAKDRVDQQMNALYGVLKDTGIPVLAEVAGQIEAVLENYRTGLVTALMDYDRAGGSTKDEARAAAIRVVQRYQTTLANDAHVTAADTNPFGVSITARATLGAALDALQSQLSAH